LVIEGFAWAWMYDDDCEYLSSLRVRNCELIARAKKVGLWSIKNPAAPWDYRKSQINKTQNYEVEEENNALNFDRQKMLDDTVQLFKREVAKDKTRNYNQEIDSVHIVEFNKKRIQFLLIYKKNIHGTNKDINNTHQDMKSLIESALNILEKNNINAYKDKFIVIAFGSTTDTRYYDPLNNPNNDKPYFDRRMCYMYSHITNEIKYYYGNSSCLVPSVYPCKSRGTTNKCEICK